jgi:hypothetical protein
VSMMAAATKPTLRELVEIPHLEFAVVVGAPMTTCMGTVKLASHHGPMCELRCEACGYQHGARVEALRRVLEHNQPREEEDLPWYQRY